MGVRTHVSQVEEGRFSQIVFQFLHHLFPSLPPSLPPPSLLSWPRSSPPFISFLPPLSPSPSPSVGEVNAGSLQCSERVQHQECVSGDWLTACDLTNKKEATAAMFPLHNQ